MHCVDQYAHVFRRRLLPYPVAKVEHVTGMRTVRIQNPASFCGDCFWRCCQQHGVQITLQGDAGADALTRHPDIRRPIQPHCVATASGNIVKPLSTTFGKRDPRDSAAFAKLLHAGHYPGDIG